MFQPDPNTMIFPFIKGARGFPGLPGQPGMKGHRVSLIANC